MTSKATNTAGLTAREVDILCAMCQSLKSKPETDMEKFATLAGFTTKASADTNLREVLKKAMAKDDAAATPEAGAGKKSGGQKRKAANDGAEEEDGEDTPTKTPKKTKAKGKKVAKKLDEGTESAEDGVGGDDGGAKVKTQAVEEVQDEDAAEDA